MAAGESYPNRAQAGLALQDLLPVGERFGIVRGSVHRAIGYLLSCHCHTAGLMLEPCQAQALLASFNAFTFRNSVLGLMPSSFAAF